MKIKYLLPIIILTISNNAISQNNPAELYLKNGDVITVQGKIKKNTFKYVRYSGDKSKRIELTELDSAKISYSRNNITTYVFYKLKNDDKIIPLKQYIIGRKANLYATEVHGTTAVVGGMGVPYTRVTYYAKKESENEVTYLGTYTPLSNNLKDNLLVFFSDCPVLIDKIKTKEFRLSKHVKEMAKFYNTSCN